MALKAYEWRNEFEGTGHIIYAESANQARMWISGEENIRYIDVRVRHLPWADNYWNECDIPAKVLLENGWACQCYRCGTWIQGLDEAHEVDEKFYCDDCYKKVQ